MISKTEDTLIQHSNPASCCCLYFEIVDQTFNIINELLTFKERLIIKNNNNGIDVDDFVSSRII